MNTKSTELDNNPDAWDSKDDRQFAIELLAGILLSAISGIVIATGLIFLCLSLID